MIRAIPIYKSMDSFNTHNQMCPSQIILEIDLPNDTQLNSKLFFDSYDYQTERKYTLPALEQILVRQAMAELVQKLLLETAYLAALVRYYENFYYFQSAIALPFYAQQYPQYYSGQYFAEPPAGNFAHRRHYLKQHRGEQAENHSIDYSINHFYPYPIDSFGLSTEIPAEPNHTSSLAHKLISIARHNLGRPVWAFTKFASLCQRGYLGCAATVSELLHEAGLNIKGSAGVSALVGELDHLGWHKIKIYDKSQFQAGDIVYGLKGSHAHIGIITAADNDKVLVCDNSSSSGILKERSIESGGSFTPNGRFAGNLYVMRALGT